jgi:hypothetical protein
MVLDDQLRPDWCIGVSAKKTERGLRVVFDTLQRIGDEPLPVWRLWTFVTHGDVDAERFLRHELSDQEYAAIGQTLCATLAAICGFEQEPESGDMKQK